MAFGPFPVSTVAGSFLLGFPTLFSIINPIGSSLVFYNVTLRRTHAERAILARRIATYGCFILLGSLWLGGYILNFFGVSLGALRVGGGLVVAVQAWSLLMAPETHESQKAGEAAPATGKRDDIAFFPLTMPLTTGPGSISVAIALASERPTVESGVLPFFLGLTLAALANALIIWISYLGADRLLRFLGEAGARAVNRLAAFLLLCIGVQIIGSGAEGLIGPWLLGIAHRA
ncbi:MAG TPA: MarC family protein [Caulobacteraceae bacterium]|jgi:multiple antibiotic resistance protein|nr:MarC family protein [Caulobacteraceae bacterium]